MPTITALTQVLNHTVSSVRNPTTVTIAQGLSWLGQLYATVSWAGAAVVLDLTQILLHAANLTPSQTIDAYLASAMTDQFITSYQSTALPQVSISGRYVNRLKVYDPTGIPGFSINAGDMSGHLADPHRMSHYADLIITGPDNTNFTNSFVMINGVVQPSVAKAAALYVKDGATNMRNKSASNIVIGDTTTLGGHRLIPLTQAMLEPSLTDPWLGVTLSLGNIDLTEATVLCVIDGYLHVLDDTYRPLSPNRMWLNIPKLDLIKNFMHNPNISFNPPPRNLEAWSTNPFITDQPIPSSTPSPDFAVNSPNYAAEIGRFLLESFPTLAQQVLGAGYTAPAILLDVGSPTALLAQFIALFFNNQWSTITADANSLTLLEAGPSVGAVSVLQDFIINGYPWMLEQTTIPTESPVGLIYLSPMCDDFAYVVQDVLLNTYPYVDAERTSATVALLSVGETYCPPAELLNAMEQFFSQYYPDMNTPAALNPNQNVAITDLASMQSFKISLQGQKGLLMTEATSRSFLYDRLFSPASFLLVIPNPALYLKRYQLSATDTAYRFTWAGADTPRGLLKYDKRYFLPYTVLSAEDLQFLLHIGLPSATSDLIQTAVNFVLWPAAHYDQFNLSVAREAELLELYSA